MGLLDGEEFDRWCSQAAQLASKASSTAWARRRGEQVLGAVDATWASLQEPGDERP